jgi:hypothetical protein
MSAKTAKISNNLKKKIFFIKLFLVKGKNFNKSKKLELKLKTRVFQVWL